MQMMAGWVMSCKNYQPVEVTTHSSSVASSTFKRSIFLYSLSGHQSVGFLTVLCNLLKWKSDLCITLSYTKIT